MGNFYENTCYTLTSKPSRILGQMLKSQETLFAVSQKILDVLVVLSSWALAYHWRFGILPAAQIGIGLVFLKMAPLVALVTGYFFYRNGLYRSYRFSSRFQEISAVVQGNFQAFLALVLILYFFAPDRISRLMLASYFFLSTFALIALRLAVRNSLRRLRRRGFNLRHFLLVGNGPQMEKYIQTVKLFKDSGIRFLGIIDGPELAQRYQIPQCQLSPHQICEQLRPDAIIIGYAHQDGDKTESLLSSCYNDVINIAILPDLGRSFLGHAIDDFGGQMVVHLNRPPFNDFDLFIKRVFDFVIASIGLICLLPLLGLIAVAIKLSSPGPIFFRQQRMGLDGEEFCMWKFRTMKVAPPDQSNTIWTTQNDPRRTSLGTFLRQTSLDELPQLWNVCKGEMSLVGPRPERPFFVEKFRQEIPAYMLRHKVKAGITGLAQINGWRGDTSLHKRLECDIYYIKHWSFWLDLKIIFLTFWKGVLHKNAY